jgi:flagellar basal body P-ring protein FlgI
MTWRTIRSNIKFIAKSKPVATSFLVGAGVVVGWFLAQIF